MDVSLIRALFAVTMLAIGGSALAQQSNDQYFQEQQQRQQQAFHAEQARQGDLQQRSMQPTAGAWRKTWGAIAADGEKGILGAVVGMESQAGAENAALRQCAERGGNCKQAVAYFNQCAALVTGNKSFVIQNAASVDEAAQIGLKTCNDGDAGCRVHFSDCTTPEFVRD